MSLIINEQNQSTCCRVSLCIDDLINIENTNHVVQGGSLIKVLGQGDPIYVYQCKLDHPGCQHKGWPLNPNHCVDQCEPYD